VLQPTAKITLASFDTGDSSTLTNTHLASRISISVASLASQFKLYALYPSLVNAMLHSRLCLQRAAEMQKISLLFGTSTVLCLNEWLTSLLLTTQYQQKKFFFIYFFFNDHLREMEEIYYV